VVRPTDQDRPRRSRSSRNAATVGQHTDDSGVTTADIREHVDSLTPAVLG
jgi:hypothetical protein